MICIRSGSLVFFVAVISITSGYCQNAGLKNGFLYQGRIYQKHPVGIQGNPGFKDQIFVKGSTVVYNGIEFSDISLFYDVVKDELIVLHPDGTTSIALVKPLVSEFTMSEDTVVNLVHPQGELEAGYYQRLLSKPSGTCLVKTQKKIHHFASSTERRSSFSEANRYFVRPLDDSLFYEVKSQSALLKHFKSHRRQLRSLLFERRVRFREQPEEAIRLVLDYMATPIQ